MTFEQINQAIAIVVIIIGSAALIISSVSLIAVSRLRSDDLHKHYYRRARIRQRAKRG